jgi:hypothetical protein
MAALEHLDPLNEDYLNKLRRYAKRMPRHGTDVSLSSRSASGSRSFGHKAQA